MNTSIRLRCFEHEAPLRFGKQRYFCSSGCSFPIINGIPRFASEQYYVRSFGLEWNAYGTAQLDSFTGTMISKTRLRRLLGSSLDVLKAKEVLEAGCGAGRFTEIMLDSGAHVFAVDLSSAVEANYLNCRSYPDYFVCQADILRLPIDPGQFDVVVCIGVVQHTPDPETTMRLLCSYLRPGGLLVMDHYTYGHPMNPSRWILRQLLIRMPTLPAIGFCRGIVAMLWPIHRMLWKVRGHVLARRTRSLFLLISPVVDLQDAYPQLGPDILRTWAILDTHDALTDRYKHLRSLDEIAGHLLVCGMIDIEAAYAGNGVEVRARKPMSSTRAATD